MFFFPYPLVQKTPKKQNTEMSPDLKSLHLVKTPITTEWQAGNKMTLSLDSFFFFKIQAHFRGHHFGSKKKMQDLFLNPNNFTVPSTGVNCAALQ